MNYRHAFHAGNFADVMKHALMVRILIHLCAKDTPFRVIDTHGGAGLYDLSDPRYAGSLEWQGGIGRLDAAPISGPAGDYLAPYLAAVAATRAEHGASFYPGSPLIARQFLRADDRLIAAELHDRVILRLRQAFGRDQVMKALHLDARQALLANIPPKERRGLVLIDPAYESRDEFATAAAMLTDAVAKWPTGIYALWYPVKDRRICDSFIASLVEAGLTRMLRLELCVDEPRLDGPLVGSGLLVVNPPWTLAEQAGVMLPALAETLALRGRASFRCDPIHPDG